MTPAKTYFYAMQGDNVMWHPEQCVIVLALTDLEAPSFSYIVEFKSREQIFFWNQQMYLELTIDIDNVFHQMKNIKTYVFKNTYVEDACVEVPLTCAVLSQAYSVSYHHLKLTEGKHWQSIIIFVKSQSLWKMTCSKLFQTIDSSQTIFTI